MIPSIEAKRTMRRLFLPLAIAAAGLVMLGQCNKPAHAQTNCGNHEEGMKQLERVHGEHRVFQGLSDKGLIIVVTASVAGSYTVLLVQPSGIGCVVDSGEAATVTAIRAPEKGS